MMMTSMMNDDNSPLDLQFSVWTLLIIYYPESKIRGSICIIVSYIAMIPVDASTTVTSSPFTPHWNLYPLTYVAPKISYPLFDNIDGDLTKDVWKGVPWSEYFDDIRGVADAPADERPNKNCKTRFKAVWDDDHLYVAALIETDFETVAEFEERNSPIFQKDSDFEAFIDPVGSNHWYKEFEMNAINTIWNLMLDKPYGDGGVEHSARVAGPSDENYYEVYHQKSAAKVLKGKVNTPGKGTTWSLEIAISYKDVFSHIDEDPKPPKAGTMWRINFSRVENKGDTNWTWQPQIVWNPKDRRFAGFVMMHLPDAWGYIVFGKSQDDGSSLIGDDSVPKDLSWPVRVAAMHVYYAQAAFFEDHGTYASNIDLLTDLIDSDITDPFDILIDLDDNGGYLVTVDGSPDGTMATVTHDRFLRLDEGGNTKES